MHWPYKLVVFKHTVESCGILEHFIALTPLPPPPHKIKGEEHDEAVSSYNVK